MAKYPKTKEENLSYSPCFHMGIGEYLAVPPLVYAANIFM